MKGSVRKILKLDSSAFALLFTEISVVWVTEISVIHTTEISVKSSAKAEESSYNSCGTFFTSIIVQAVLPKAK